MSSEWGTSGFREVKKCRRYKIIDDELECNGFGAVHICACGISAFYSTLLVDAQLEIAVIKFEPEPTGNLWNSVPGMNTNNQRICCNPTWVWVRKCVSMCVCVLVYVSVCMFFHLCVQCHL